MFDLFYSTQAAAHHGGFLYAIRLLPPVCAKRAICITYGVLGTGRKAVDACCCSCCCCTAQAGVRVDKIYTIHTSQILRPGVTINNMLDITTCSKLYYLGTRVRKRGETSARGFCWWGGWVLLLDGAFMPIVNLTKYKKCMSGKRRAKLQMPKQPKHNCTPPRPPSELTEFHTRKPPFFLGLRSGGRRGPARGPLFGSLGVAYMSICWLLVLRTDLVSVPGVSSGFLHQPLHDLQATAGARPEEGSGPLFTATATRESTARGVVSNKTGAIDPPRQFFSAQKKKKSGNGCEPNESVRALCAPRREFLFFFSAKSL